MITAPELACAERWCLPLMNVANSGGQNTAQQGCCCAHRLPTAMVQALGGKKGGGEGLARYVT